ncbi:hypothetical protein P691DRAFT_768400 [Macrolepiota fuliginosa MF-IS2]|uniref:Uncharacterized protein n=1 Tax=Macrolepiota fuliginosa MF-IS2 TaxID=1400762 RepID=A0A9P6BVQ5_9AGAR|nr:hypothetical protein P691DRAFT_768400 [Macrolepiota fuliginosa MF-IS2]
MSSATTLLTTVPALCGASNYDNWQFQMLNIFSMWTVTSAAGATWTLGSFVTRARTLPPIVNAQAITAQEHTDWVEWRVNDGIALAIINTKLDKTLQHHGYATLAEAWDHFATCFGTFGLPEATTHIQFIQNFTFSMMHDPSEEIAEWMSHMTALENQALMISGPLQAMMILMRILDAWITTRQTMLLQYSTNISTLTITIVATAVHAAFQDTLPSTHAAHFTGVHAHGHNPNWKNQKGNNQQGCSQNQNQNQLHNQPQQNQGQGKGNLNPPQQNQSSPPNQGEQKKGNNCRRGWKKKQQIATLGGTSDNFVQPAGLGVAAIATSTQINSGASATSSTFAMASPTLAPSTSTGPSLLQRMTTAEVASVPPHMASFAATKDPWMLPPNGHLRGQTTLQKAQRHTHKMYEKRLSSKFPCSTSPLPDEGKACSQFYVMDTDFNHCPASPNVSPMYMDDDNMVSLRESDEDTDYGEDFIFTTTIALTKQALSTSSLHSLTSSLFIATLIFDQRAARGDPHSCRSVSDAPAHTSISPPSEGDVFLTASAFGTQREAQHDVAGPPPSFPSAPWDVRDRYSPALPCQSRAASLDPATPRGPSNQGSRHSSHHASPSPINANTLTPALVEEDMDDNEDSEWAAPLILLETIEGLDGDVAAIAQSIASMVSWVSCHQVHF